MVFILYTVVLSYIEMRLNSTYKVSISGGYRGIQGCKGTPFARVLCNYEGFLVYMHVFAFTIEHQKIRTLGPLQAGGNKNPGLPTC